MLLWNMCLFYHSSVWLPLTVLQHWNVIINAFMEYVSFLSF
jgi:hypothetical protein